MTESALPPVLDELWERRAELSPDDEDARKLVVAAVDQLDAGEARVAQVVGDDVVVDERAKHAILLAFKVLAMEEGSNGGFYVHDRVPLKQSFPGVRVVSGAIGGGGRLNFSVIGDPVNVAARVEQLTRDTGDDVLLAEQTKDALRNDFELEPRGRFELRGIDEPVALYAPVPVAAGDGRPSPSPVPGTLAGSEDAIARSRS